MKWDQHNPTGAGKGALRDGWMRQFLRAEAAKQAAMLARIRERVERDLERTEKAGAVPDESTMRAARFAQQGFQILATLEIESARLELDARRVLGKAPMSDEEYQAKLQDLGRDAVRALSDEEFAAEAERRKRALAAGG